MAVEDFTTYTEQDGTGALAVTATKVTATNMDSRDFNYWVISDKGVGHFGDFEHKYTAQMTGANQGQFTAWQLGNTIGDAQDCEVAGVGVCNYFYDDVEVIGIEDFSDLTVDEFAYNSDVVVYLTASRSGTTLQLLIYSDSGRTTLLDTLTLTVPTTTFRYVAVATGYNSGSGTDIPTAYVENLDLQESTPTGNNRVSRMTLLGCG